ncbi:hypothetical protein Pint_12065 [Pistacia integerrima]|uniref:Uncharacterized protein n=1 Tax=Pistacia integerrima TaxID=434235 RepID=A0ACC0XG04_9ROSI|nr:hypothetical protein Pint_12065 [Pistacia integerrima]
MHANGKLEPLECKLAVVTPIGDSLVLEYVYRRSVVRIGEHELQVDLIPLDMYDFDVILVMDWLALHRAIVDCFREEVTFKKRGKPKFVFCGECRILPSCVISAMTTRRLLRKQCPSCLAHVVDTRINELRLEDILVVREFPDVFPKDLPGLPPDREVEFTIDLVPGLALISMAPYGMAPHELQELKVQLQELVDKGFIRPSVSSWGAPVLFVKKKDGTFRLCIDY